MPTTRTSALPTVRSILLRPMTEARLATVQDLFVNLDEEVTRALTINGTTVARIKVRVPDLYSNISRMISIEWDFTLTNLLAEQNQSEAANTERIKHLRQFMMKGYYSLRVAHKDPVLQVSGNPSISGHSFFKEIATTTSYLYGLQAALNWVSALYLMVTKGDEWGRIYSTAAVNTYRQWFGSEVRSERDFATIIDPTFHCAVMQSLIGKTPREIIDNNNYKFYLDFVHSGRAQPLEHSETTVVSALTNLPFTAFPSVCPYTEGVYAAMHHGTIGGDVVWSENRAYKIAREHTYINGMICYALRHGLGTDGLIIQGLSLLGYPDMPMRWYLRERCMYPIDGGRHLSGTGWVPKWKLDHWRRTGEYGECCQCHTEQLNLVELDEGRTCPRCLEAAHLNLTVHPYGLDVHTLLKPVMIGKRFVHTGFLNKTPLLFGIEAEYNCSRESTPARAYLAKCLKDHAIFKHDGSLNSHGFEIVTVAAPKEVHEGKWRRVFEKFPGIIAKGDQGAGMHVHVTKEAMTPLTMARVGDFMHNRDNQSFIETVAERKLDRWAKQDHNRGFGWYLMQRQSNLTSDRHVSFNTNKAKTAEFRIFVSPWEYFQFCKNLEFIDRLIYMMQAGWSMFTPKQSRHWSAFTKLIKEENRSKNPDRCTALNLYNFLIQKGVYS